jgi:hypothetical protein
MAARTSPAEGPSSLQRAEVALPHLFRDEHQCVERLHRRADRDVAKGGQVRQKRFDVHGAEIDGMAVEEEEAARPVREGGAGGFRRAPLARRLPAPSEDAGATVRDGPEPQERAGASPSIHRLARERHIGAIPFADCYRHPWWKKEQVNAYDR